MHDEHDDPFAFFRGLLFALGAGAGLGALAIALIGALA